MARRPVFIPDEREPSLVREHTCEFHWHPGFATVQKQRSIESLHEAASAAGFEPVLEISTKSPDELGQQLSAFNLKVPLPSGEVAALESVFQGSKVFSKGGPFVELYSLSPADARNAPQLTSSGDLTGFRFDHQQWELETGTAFYDWLYIKAVATLDGACESLMRYAGFTDIEFNPKRSLNCQARSAALLVGLARIGWLESAISDPDAFYKITQHGQAEDAQPFAGQQHLWG
jgi:hypothetical protein